jgi:hypothetical protein
MGKADEEYHVTFVAGTDTWWRPHTQRIDWSAGRIYYEFEHWYARPVYWLWRRWQWVKDWLT